MQKRRVYYRTRNCVVCGRPYKAARCSSLTCSDACRKRRSRAGQRSRKKSVTGVTIADLEQLLLFNPPQAV